jgi:hypothetical protein
MATLLDIYNTALFRVKEQPLISDAATGRVADAVKQTYRIQRPALLRRYRWQFATARVELSPLASEPPPGWKHHFQLPADFLTVIGVVSDKGIGKFVLTEEPRRYRVMGNRIVSDDDKIVVTYTRDVTAVADFDPLFVDALCWAMAQDLALALAADRELAVMCAEMFNEALKAARRAGSLEQPAEAVLYSSRVLDARDSYGGWNPRFPEALP